MIKILCPVDFSDASLNALDYASHFAIRYQAKLTLLHVFTEKDIDLTLGQEEAGLSFKNKMEQAEERLKSLVHVMKEERGKASVQIDHTLKLGKLTDSIVELSNEDHYQLIIMGTNGNSRAMVGSHTIHAIKKSNIPVLAIPEGHRYKTPHNFVYATDYEKADKAAMQFLIALAQPFKATVSVLHVSGVNSKLSQEKYNAFVEEIISFVQYDKLLFARKMASEDVGHGIDEYMTEHDADILVLLNRPRGFVEKILHQSITEQISRFADYPYLILKSTIEK